MMGSKTWAMTGAVLCATVTAFGADDSAAKKVTFYQDVLPIMQENCQVCHRDGGANLGGMVAPMAFTSYDDVRPWAKAIAENVAAKKMPPWHASPDQHARFENERTLTQEEIDTIVAWAQSGAAKGNPKDAPAPKEWPQTDGWSIGTPDIVLNMRSEPFFVGDDVADQYEYFQSTITKEMLPEPRWIKAIEFRPGSKVVHHIIATPLGGIAPGNDPTVFPDGMGRLLRPDTEVTWQMHYHKEPGPGTGVYDNSQAAIKLYPKDAEINHILRDESLGRFDFMIPAGQADYRIQTEHTFEEDVNIVSFLPHMHVRGKYAKYEAFYPDGSSKVLLEVPQYDFNWQTTYRFKDLEFAPKGTKLVLTTAWDNSVENPNNPDPTKNVTFGEPTTDEMSFGFMNYIRAVDQEDINAALSDQGDGFGGRARRQNINLAELSKTFDVNKDGLLQKDECPGFMSRFFPMIDANKDDALSQDELVQAQKMMENLRGRERPATEQPQL